MIKLTRAQRVALKARFDRGPLYAKDAHLTTSIGGTLGAPLTPLTYRQFRARVQPCFDGSGCVMVHWCGMWLGIETDGYAHS